MNITLKKFLFVLYLLFSLVLGTFISGYVGLRNMSGPLSYGENVTVFMLIAFYMFGLFLYSKHLGKRYVWLTLLFFGAVLLFNVSTWSFNIVKNRIASSRKALSTSSSISALYNAINITDILSTNLPQSTDKRVSFTAVFDLNKLPQQINAYKVEVYQGEILMLSQLLTLDGGIFAIEDLDTSQEFYATNTVVSDTTLGYSFNYYPSLSPEVRFKLTDINNPEILYQREIQLPL